MGQIFIDEKVVDEDSIEVDGVETWDYPDFADAYADYAEFEDGTPLTEQQLELLSDQHSEIIHEKAHRIFF